MTGMGGRGKLCSARGVVLGSPARGWGHCTRVGLNQGGSTASAHGAAPHLSPFTSIWGRKTDAIFLQPSCAGAQGQGPSAAPSSTGEAFCPFHGGPVPALSPIHRVSRALGLALLGAFSRRSQVGARRQEELSGQPSRTPSPSVVVLFLAPPAALMETNTCLLQVLMRLRVFG